MRKLTDIEKSAGAAIMKDFGPDIATALHRCLAGELLSVTQNEPGKFMYTLTEKGQIKLQNSVPDMPDMF